MAEVQVLFQHLLPLPPGHPQGAGTDVEWLGTQPSRLIQTECSRPGLAHCTSGLENNTAVRLRGPT